ncbi:MAG TPA: hypothetical protein VK327_00705 [Candidatus Paceibacterota bacterium]|nr:hypothetical protein [Candidatus Paceibacterota bacterium]
MNNPENTPPASSETADLQQQVADLRRQAGTLSLALAVLSLTLAAFIGLQARRAGKDLDTIRPQANQLLDVNKKDDPLVQAFFSQLDSYGKGHPDYAEKVLSKIRLSSNATGAPAPTATPAKK